LEQRVVESQREVEERLPTQQTPEIQIGWIAKFWLGTAVLPTRNDFGRRCVAFDPLLRS
jgi:hypothetical protein